MLETSIRNQVIRLHFQGYGRNEIGRKIRRIHRSFSPASVTNIISEFEQIVNSEGLESAAERYGVSELVLELHEISMTLRENKLEISECIEGARTEKKLKDLGVNVENFGQFVKFYEKTQPENYDPATIIQKLFDQELFSIPLTSTR